MWSLGLKTVKNKLMTLISLLCTDYSILEGLPVRIKNPNYTTWNSGGGGGNEMTKSTIGQKYSINYFLIPSLSN